MKTRKVRYIECSNLDTGILVKAYFDVGDFDGTATLYKSLQGDKWLTTIETDHELGIFETKFNVDNHLANMNSWIGDHKVNGED